MTTTGNTVMEDYWQAYATFIQNHANITQVYKQNSKEAIQVEDKGPKFKTGVCAFCGTRKNWKNLIKAHTHPLADQKYVCLNYDWCDRKIKLNDQ
jgi:hypothetical protein